MIKTLVIAIAAGVCLSPSFVLGHPGHGPASLTSGVAHPFTGIDHLLAMLATGIWAVQLGRRARWLVPLAFLAAMAVGGVAAFAGVPLPAVESVILASLLVLGLAVVLSVRLPAGVGAVIAAGFALFHGYAHGAELPANATALSFTVGFLLSTAIILALGEWLGSLLCRIDRRPGLRLLVRSTGGVSRTA